MAAALLAFAVFPASGQTWRAQGASAGFYVGGTPNGMYLRCSGANVTVNFTGFAARLPQSATYRVGVSIDGLARILRTTAYTVRGRSVLVHGDSMAALGSLIEDLRKGKSVEVSTPAGRYLVPLAGSGKALASFVETCGA